MSLNAYTKPGMSWSAFTRTISELGFEIVESQRFEYCDPTGRITHPTDLIAAHRAKKLILHAVSYISASTDEETLNSGNLTGTIDPSSVDPVALKETIGRCMHYGIRHGSTTAVFFSSSLHNDIASLIRGIESIGMPFVNWGNPIPFLWLLNTTEENQGVDHTQRRDEFFGSAPQWVLDFIR